ncbi:hypothetical protein [Sphingomonas sp. 35-24ZXX]|uniref:hypothetical protein n=1 Tax=Sphingomonas sp. 35-24ZXX TaxID=1545915 RepID=UPI00053BDFF5|nr:hypothetical protein [Sphingomonas sp. 35-24ZXX]
MMRRSVLLIATVASCIWPGQAFAQPATTSIDATATLKDAPAVPLAFRVVQPLQFGTVVIPSKLRANTVCEYRLQAVASGTTGTLASVTEKDANGASVPVVSGCAFEGTQRTAQVELTCQTARPVTLQVAYQTASLSGSTFAQDITGGAGLYLPALGAGEQSSGVIPLSGNIPCQPANASTTVVLLLAGRLSLINTDTLTRGSSLNVGTITIEASY